MLLPDEDEAIIWCGPLIGGATRQFWGDVVWGGLDVLVVDLPPGTSDASLTVNSLREAISNSRARSAP